MNEEDAIFTDTLMYIIDPDKHGGVPFSVTWHRNSEFYFKVRQIHMEAEKAANEAMRRQLQPDIAYRSEDE